MRFALWFGLAVSSLSACGDDVGAATTASGADAVTADLAGADGGGDAAAQGLDAETAGHSCQIEPVGARGDKVCTFYRCADAVIASGACEPGDYVMGFACKYAERYLDEVYPSLSAAGQGFLDGVFVCLQERLLPAVDAATTCAEAAELGFGAHVPCYSAAGFCALPPGDLSAIVGAIDDADLEHPLQQAATLEILGRCNAD